MSGLVRESWARALGREEPSSCACATRFPRLPAPTTQIRRSPPRASLGSLGLANREPRWSDPPSAPSPHSSCNGRARSSPSGLGARARPALLAFRGVCFRQMLSAYRATWGVPFLLSPLGHNAACCRWRPAACFEGKAVWARASHKCGESEGKDPPFLEVKWRETSLRKVVWEPAGKSVALSNRVWVGWIRLGAEGGSPVCGVKKTWGISISYAGSFHRTRDVGELKYFH